MNKILFATLWLHCVVWADGPRVDIPAALNHCRPGAIWDLYGDDYSGLIWKADGQGGGKPTLEELNTAWQEVLAIRAARKVWPDAGAFWSEFTLQEKAAIVASNDATIKLIMEELRMWRGEVWSDDPAGGGRVMMGLNALVSAGIISEQRKMEVLAK